MKNQLEKNNKTYSDLKNLQKILKQNRILGFDFNVVQSEFHASDAHEKCDLVSNNKFTRIIDIYSSGRICGWVILFKDLKKKNIIFGKGFFHDKIYLKEYQKIASNSYINILYNSGIIGFIPIMFFFIFINRKYEMIYELYSQFNYYDFLKFNLMLYLLLRSFFEDTFAFVSIDLILFLTCYVNLSNKMKIILKK